MLWQKGQSGNPKGKPKNGKCLTAQLRVALQEANAEGIPQAKALADKLLALANGGDLDAIKYIYDRVDGKPVETQQLTGQNGGPLTLRIVESIVANRNQDDD